MEYFTSILNGRFPTSIYISARVHVCMKGCMSVSFKQIVSGCVVFCFAGNRFEFRIWRLLEVSDYSRCIQTWGSYRFNTEGLFGVSQSQFDVQIGFGFKSISRKRTTWHPTRCFYYFYFNFYYFSFYVVTFVCHWLTITTTNVFNSSRIAILATRK